MFFSEEKNQKTFASARVRKSGTWPDGWKTASRVDEVLVSIGQRPRLSWTASTPAEE
jgi:hypothetical protein